MVRNVMMGSKVGLVLLVIAAAPGAFAAQEQPSQLADRKEPWLAARLSRRFPGLGNFYAGERGHGWRHVGIAVAGLGLFGTGVAQQFDDPRAGNGWALIVTGLVVSGGNAAWAVSSSIADVERYNHRASLKLRPALRVLPAARAGLEVGRLTF